VTKAIRRALAHRARGEAGFTLVEVIVAMMITLIVMTSLSFVVVSALKTIQQGKQRQTATALATQQLERLRAMPYDQVTLAASGASVLAPNPYATVSGAITTLDAAALQTLVPGVTAEPLVLNTVSGQWADQQVDNVTYRVYTYVTRPAVASGGQTFNLTVVVRWTSNVWPSGRTAVERTTTFSPAGCLSTSTSPFAAPCQVYVTTRAGDAQAGVSVSSTEDPAVTPWLLGATGVEQLQLAFPATSSSFYVEQTATGNAAAVTTSSILETSSGATTTGGQSAKAAVDSDPSSTPNQSVNVTTPSHSVASQSVNDGKGASSRGTLTMTQGGSDVGHARSAIGADTSICRGLSDAALVTGTPARPCSSADIQPGGTGSSLVYRSPVGGGDVTLARFAPNGQSRSVAGSFGQATTGSVCGGSGTPVDCVYAAAQRTLGTAAFSVASNVVNAGFPTAPVAFDAGGGLPVLSATAAFDASIGLWSVTGLTESAWVEEGTGARIPGGTSFSRSGTLSVWTGTAGNGYTTVNLADYSAPVSAANPAPDPLTIFPTEIAYSNEVTLRYSGQVTIQRPKIASSPTFTSARNVATQCKANACQTTIDSSGGVVASVNVEVFVNGAPLTSFAVVTDLGGLTADVSYKAATDAA